MTTRILPPEEWDRLDATGAEVPWRHLDPVHTRVIVTEHGEVITGVVVLMQAVHAEFLWIAPAQRGRVAVARRLRNRVVAEVRAWRFPTVLMASMSKTMAGILCGLGADRLPGDHYVLNLKEVA